MIYVNIIFFSHFPFNSLSKLKTQEKSLRVILLSVLLLLE